LELTQVFGVKNGTEIIDEVKSVIEQWTKFADKSAVSSTSKMLIAKTTKALMLA